MGQNVARSGWKKLWGERRIDRGRKVLSRSRPLHKLLTYLGFPHRPVRQKFRQP